MDPNPKKFPVLSYVLSRLNSIRNPNPNPNTSFDVEQPPPPSSASRHHHVELMERMPHLDHPVLLASMARAVADVSQTRSVLQSLGDRPDHEAVDAARARVSLIDAELADQLEEIALAPAPDGVDAEEWRAAREEECKKKAEEGKRAFRAVVQLDEMHEAYENLLREAEERLVGIYGEEHPDDVVEVDEEVVGILQDASKEGVEKVDLSGRQLRFLPEAFGRLRGLVVLVLSSNQLEIIPDSIAGLEHLEELHISSNLLVSLPDSIGLLLNLKILDVSGNKLKALPDSISRCRSLVELDASFNELTYLPTNIGHGLVNLQKLMIHLNKIRFLPMSICELSSLRLLDAHFNELHGLPRAIGKLVNLEILDLSSNFNDLTELPESFGDLINLRELNLSNNQIHSLPDSFGRLDNLVKLNLEQNPIVIPPVEVVNEGVEAVKEFMTKRLVDILLEEEQKNAVETETESGTGWLTRSTSWLSNVVSGVSGSVSGYLGAGQKTYRDPYLDQQL